ncbi:DUF3618 domain-containing protein [Allosphingosinicella sp.]|uniref:DUF3618 domain-containing protein n=1 Tax=Allosphingosinicella sp. TaxID=2823234 RepID=UPI002FC1FF59
MTHPTARIEQAKREVEQARRQLASTTGALQYRLKPGNLVSSAWEGVREKSGEMANGALRTVKDRPVATSGVLAALVIFLAREPLWRLASGFLGENEDDVDAGTIEADLDHHDKGYDLTAPTIGRSKKEGVKV